MLSSMAKQETIAELQILCWNTGGHRQGKKKNKRENYNRLFWNTVTSTSPKLAIAFLQEVKMIGTQGGGQQEEYHLFKGKVGYTELFMKEKAESGESPLH